MQNQDEQLDDVSHTVGNLRQQAREMGEELDDQAMLVTQMMLLMCRILEDIDQHVEGTYDKLKKGSKRLQRFILANEGFFSC
jgi:member of the syntaxin family of t-SNAREs